MTSRPHHGAAVARFFAKPRRRHAIAPGERVVEPAHAGKAAGEGHLGHRPRGLSEQLLGEQQAPREQQLNGRNAELVLHDSPNLPRAELELAGNRLEARFLVELPFRESLDNQLRNPLRIVHRRVSRRKLWPAAQTRAEARLLGLLSRIIESAIGCLWRLHPAHRPAVDAGRGDADEEHAVEPRIVRRQCVVKPAMILAHLPTIARRPLPH